MADNNTDTTNEVTETEQEPVAKPRKRGSTATVELPRDAMVPATQLEDIQYKLAQATEALAAEKVSKQSLRAEKEQAQTQAKRTAIESALRSSATEVSILPNALEDHLPILIDQYTVDATGKVVPKDNLVGDYKEAFRSWVEQRPYVKGVTAPQSTNLNQVNAPYNPAGQQQVNVADVKSLQAWLNSTPGSVRNRQ